MLNGIVDLLEEIQFLSAEDSDLSEEIVCGQECAKCEENFYNGVVHDGEFLCEKCAKKG